MKIIEFFSKINYLNSILKLTSKILPFILIYFSTVNLLIKKNKSQNIYFLLYNLLIIIFSGLIGVFITLFSQIFIISYIYYKKIQKINFMYSLLIFNNSVFLLFIKILGFKYMIKIFNVKIGIILNSLFICNIYNYFLTSYIFEISKLYKSHYELMNSLNKNIFIYIRFVTYILFKYFPYRICILFIYIICDNTIIFFSYPEETTIFKNYFFEGDNENLFSVGLCNSFMFFIYFIIIKIIKYNNKNN